MGKVRDFGPVGGGFGPYRGNQTFHLADSVLLTMGFIENETHVHSHGHIENEDLSGLRG